MKNIRIGKDIALKWTLTVDGVSRDLSVLDLRLFLHNEMAGSSVELAFTTQTDVLRTEVLGRDQRNTGVYRLTLWLNKDKTGQSVLDESTAFRLVARTEMEGGVDDNNLETESVELSGNLATDGYKDYSELSERVEALEAEMPNKAAKEEAYGYALNRVQYNEDNVMVEQVNGEYAKINAATTETAGVMSAADKVALDAAVAKNTQQDTEIAAIKAKNEEQDTAMGGLALDRSEVGADWVQVVQANGNVADIGGATITHAGVMTAAQVQALGAAVALSQTNAGAISAETTARQDADTALQGRVTTVEGGKQDKVAVVEEDSAVIANPLTPATGTYTRFLYPQESVQVILPAMPAPTYAVALSIYLETGANPQVTFTSADNTPIAYYDGFAIEGNKKYEINCLFNGAQWILAYGTIA